MLTKAGGVAKETEIVIRPKVGTVTIETRGLQEQLGRMGLRSSVDCDFYLNNTLVVLITVARRLAIAYIIIRKVRGTSPGLNG